MYFIKYLINKDEVAIKKKKFNNLELLIKIKNKINNK